MKFKYNSMLFSPVFILLFFFGSCKKSVVTADATADANSKVTTYEKASNQINVWLTTADKTSLIQRQPNLAFDNAFAANIQTISVDDRKKYQPIDGFGYCLTSGSATLLNQLGPNQAAILNELFGTGEDQMGISYLRISIGASDLSAFPYTYDETPIGTTDVNLDKFSIEIERTDLIPILKKILAINPNIKLLATPWTAPTWMKINSNLNSGYMGGSLNPIYYDVYARYFVKYLKAMQAEGITINAISPQNEPLHGGNNPSMVMQPAEQTNFIKNNLGPGLRNAGLSTKIIAYDHNADRIDYPKTIFADPLASSYVDGAAFHLYAGDINALSDLHNSYPKKNIYFTEQYVGGPGNFGGDFNWHVNNLIIGATRNWSRTVLEWNLASDPAYMPHTVGGCNTCEGALTIAATQVIRNVSYYIIGQASKFVKPGAVRIGSNVIGNIQNVAFQNADGTKILIALNTGSVSENFNVKYSSKTFSYTLPPGAAATFKWN